MIIEFQHVWRNKSLKIFLLNIYTTFLHFFFIKKNIFEVVTWI